MATIFTNSLGESLSVSDAGLVSAHSLQALGFVRQGAPGGDPDGDGSAGDAEGDGADTQAPSKSASRAVWAEYAAALAVDVEGLKRDGIISKLADAATSDADPAAEED